MTICLCQKWCVRGTQSSIKLQLSSLGNCVPCPLYNFIAAPVAAPSAASTALNTAWSSNWSGYHNALTTTLTTTLITAFISVLTTATAAPAAITLQTVTQVWRFAGVQANAVVDTAIRSCFVSQDTRVHRAGIHALIAIIRSCWPSGEHRNRN